MKTFNQTDLEGVIEELNALGETFTNLDIKNSLRKKGFYATQSRVRLAVTRQIASGLLNVSEYQPYRQYTGSSAVSVAIDDVVTSQPSMKSRKRRSDSFKFVDYGGGEIGFTRKDGELVTCFLNEDTLEDGDYWKATNVITNAHIFVPACYTRDIARQAIASYAQVSFIKTRARFIKKN